MIERTNLPTERKKMEKWLELKKEFTKIGYQLNEKGEVSKIRTGETHFFNWDAQVYPFESNRVIMRIFRDSSQTFWTNFCEKSKFRWTIYIEEI